MFVEDPLFEPEWAIGRRSQHHSAVSSFSAATHDDWMIANLDLAVPTAHRTSNKALATTTHHHFAALHLNNPSLGLDSSAAAAATTTFAFGYPTASIAAPQPSSSIALSTAAGGAASTQPSWQLDIASLRVMSITPQTVSASVFVAVDVSNAATAAFAGFTTAAEATGATEWDFDGDATIALRVDEYGSAPVPPWPSSYDDDVALHNDDDDNDDENYIVADEEGESATITHPNGPRTMTPVVRAKLSFTPAVRSASAPIDLPSSSSSSSFDIQRSCPIAIPQKRSDSFSSLSGCGSGATTTTRRSSWSIASTDRSSSSSSSLDGSDRNNNNTPSMSPIEPSSLSSSPPDALDCGIYKSMEAEEDLPFPWIIE